MIAVLLKHLVDRDNAWMVKSLQSGLLLAQRVNPFAVARLNLLNQESVTVFVGSVGEAHSSQLVKTVDLVVT